MPGSPPRARPQRSPRRRRRRRRRCPTPAWPPRATARARWLAPPGRARRGARSAVPGSARHVPDGEPRVRLRAGRQRRPAAVPGAPGRRPRDDGAHAGDAAGAAGRAVLLLLVAGRERHRLRARRLGVRGARAQGGRASQRRGGTSSARRGARGATRRRGSRGALREAAPRPESVSFSPCGAYVSYVRRVIRKGMRAPKLTGKPFEDEGDDVDGDGIDDWFNQVCVVKFEYRLRQPFRSIKTFVSGIVTGAAAVAAAAAARHAGEALLAAARRRALARLRARAGARWSPRRASRRRARRGGRSPRTSRRARPTSRRRRGRRPRTPGPASPLTSAARESVREGTSRRMMTRARGRAAVARGTCFF